MLKKIVSGGQTGADQAGLDAAIKRGIQHGGWIPKGRLTENGPLAAHYGLQEMPGPSYAARTKQNVIDSDATLIIAHGELSSGSALTRNLARQLKKPYLFLDLDQLPNELAAQQARDWLHKNQISVLNIAGPRASNDPGIYKAVFNLLNHIFAQN